MGLQSDFFSGDPKLEACVIHLHRKSLTGGNFRIGIGRSGKAQRAIGYPPHRPASACGGSAID